MLLGGRGAGKTAAAARYVHEVVHGPPMIEGVPGGHWISIVGPTLGDAVTSCVMGPSGLRKWDPGIRVVQVAGGTICRWSNGVEAKLFGAHNPEDVERFRAGGNRTLVWCEEMAAWRYLEESWQQIRYGLRSGLWPHAVISTTPKNRKVIKEIVTKAREAAIAGEENPEYVVTKAHTNENPYLDDRVARMLYEDYEGTRLGRQELHAEILEDIEGALWNDDMIHRNRLSLDSYPETLQRTVIGVDPQAKEGAAETGIVAMGCQPQRWRDGETLHGYVLGDYSIDGSPQKWGKRVVAAYHDFEADTVIAEINNGGDMVKHIIQTIDANVPVRVVHASRGKAKRAEPVSALYEQNRMHHIGVMPELEDQMTSWDPTDDADEWSPDRLDAMVWAAHALMLNRSQSQQQQMQDHRLRGRR